MKKQILIIHGGTTFEKNGDYIDFLKNVPLEIDRLKFKQDWKNTIAEDLGDNHEVLAPRMPNGTNAKYNEWKIWFERILPLMNKEIILIGHSLGGIFLAKYLSQNTVSKNIKALILVSAPFNDTPDESLASFRLPKSLRNIHKQAMKIILIHSKDDKVVPVEQVNQYSRQLPNSETILFEDRGHFKIEHFPELVEMIKSI